MIISSVSVCKENVNSINIFSVYAIHRQVQILLLLFIFSYCESGAELLFSTQGQKHGVFYLLYCAKFQ